MLSFRFFFNEQVKVVVMDKNDSPPTFHGIPESFTVSEDLETGQLVAKIKATDPDTIGKLEYSLLSGDDGNFVLDKFDGTLKLRGTLDREKKDLYKLLVRVTDGVQYTETTISVQVRSSSSMAIEPFVNVSILRLLTPTTTHRSSQSPLTHSTFLKTRLAATKSASSPPPIPTSEPTLCSLTLSSRTGRTMFSR